MVEVLTAAIRGSDAYAAVRRAVKLEEGVLRVGNRFVQRSKVREVAFLAVGNCAAAMARGFHDALGEVVTQGLVGGPEPPPEPWPFLFRKVSDPLLPTTEGAALAAEAIEMAEGLSGTDLFVPLLSPGAQGMLSTPPPGLDLPTYRALLEKVLEGSRRSDEDLPAIVSVLSPAQGGGLARAARATSTEALWVVREVQEAANRPLGAGPTFPASPEAAERARSVLGSLGLYANLPSSVRDRLAPGGAPGGAVGPDLHNVIVVSPSDALETAGAEAAFRKHRPHLVKLHDPSGPEEAADHLLAALEERAPHRPSESKEGIALFSGVTLGAPEGGEERELIFRFLARAGSRLQRREATVAILYTGGSLSPSTTPSGGMVDARGTLTLAKFVPRTRGVLDLTPGFTDVGSIAVAYLGGPGEGPSPEPRRRR